MTFTLTITAETQAELDDQIADYLMRGAKIYESVDEILEDRTRATRTDPPEDPDKYYPFGRSCQEQSHSDLRSLIAGYMEHGMLSEAIKQHLIIEHSWAVPIKTIQGHMGQITRKAKEGEEYRQAIKRTAALVSKAPQSPRKPNLPHSTHIPTSEPEATIYKLWYSNAFNSEIKAYLLEKGYSKTLDEIKKIIEGFQ